MQVMMQIITNFFRSGEGVTFRRLLCAGSMAWILLLNGGQSMAEEAKYIYMQLDSGTVRIETLPDLAPNHVSRITRLVDEGFYDGVVFHRVIAGFMAQTGDPTGTGRGGSGHKLDAEFSREPHVRGIVSMARSSSPHSADSQFFIVYDEVPHLDGKYTVWGRVVEGMELIEAIPEGTGGNGRVVDEPVKILRMSLTAPK